MEGLPSDGKQSNPCRVVAGIIFYSTYSGKAFHALREDIKAEPGYWKGRKVNQNKTFSQQYFSCSSAARFCNRCNAFFRSLNRPLVTPVQPWWLHGLEKGGITARHCIADIYSEVSPQ